MSPVFVPSAALHHQSPSSVFSFQVFSCPLPDPHRHPCHESGFSCVSGLSMSSHSFMPSSFLSVFFFGNPAQLLFLLVLSVEWIQFLLDISASGSFLHHHATQLPIIMTTSNLYLGAKHHERPNNNKSCFVEISCKMCSKCSVVFSALILHYTRSEQFAVTHYFSYKPFLNMLKTNIIQPPFISIKNTYVS